MLTIDENLVCPKCGEIKETFIKPRLWKEVSCGKLHRLPRRATCKACGHEGTVYAFKGRGKWAKKAVHD